MTGAFSPSNHNTLMGLRCVEQQALTEGRSTPAGKPPACTHAPEPLTRVEDLPVLDELPEGVEHELLGGHGHVAVPQGQLLQDHVQRGGHAAGVEVQQHAADGVRQGHELGLGDHLHLDTVHVTWRESSEDKAGLLMAKSSTFLQTHTSIPSSQF